jgi:hypothetical protein
MILKVFENMAHANHSTAAIVCFFVVIFSLIGCGVGLLNLESLAGADGGD